MILHSQDKPFKCTYCEEHFKSRFARLKHQEKFHLGKQISLSRSILATIDASHRAGGGGCCGLTGRKPHNLGRRGFAAVLRNEYIQGFCEVWAGGQMCSWSNCIHLPSIVGQVCECLGQVFLLWEKNSFFSERVRNLVYLEFSSAFDEFSPHASGQGGDLCSRWQHSQAHS